MSAQGVILRFEKVTFEYGHNKRILDEVDFSVRRGMKITLMGQNGAGKSTLFSLITGAVGAKSGRGDGDVARPESGKVNVTNGITVALSRQTIPRGDLDLTVREFFEKCFSQKIYDIDPRIDEVLEAVNFSTPHDRIIRSFSGGQQARLLLASALIQNPDLLLLDEPTNNLDKAGIEHLTHFLQTYKKSVIVISHDADFLNSFTDGVLYLDVHTRKIEQYVGNYFDVMRDITARIEKENMKNAQLAKEIQENKDKANFFSHKGGQMRLVAKRMRERAEELEDEIVDVRKEDRTIRPFTIPNQPEVTGEIINITSFQTIRNHKPTPRSANITLKRNQHLLIRGPNGIGKSTLLQAIVDRKPGSVINSDIRVGYYRQDFSMLDFDATVHDSLIEVTERKREETMRSVAAGFLITADVMDTKIGDLSEGQKGLVAFARLVLERPGLLILDEPTNHINFRHIPVIAEALNTYEGAMIMVSHVHEFVDKIRIDQILEIDK